MPLTGNILCYFSDPAGAKLVLALLENVGDNSFSAQVFSNKDYEFYSEFSTRVNVIDDYRYLSEYISTKKPDCVIVGTSLPTSYELRLLKDASNMSITSTALVDYPSNLTKRFLDDSSQLILPNLICVTSVSAFNMAIDEGIPKKYLKTIQNPYHIFLRSLNKKLTSRTSSVEGNENTTNSSNTSILFVPEPILQNNLQESYGFNEMIGLDLLIDVLNQLGRADISLVVKPHPNHAPFFESYVQMRKESCSFTLNFAKQENLTQLILTSDFVIGFYSNAVLDADVLRSVTVRPLFLASSNKRDPLDGQLSHLSHIASTQESFKTIISSLICRE